MHIKSEKLIVYLGQVQERSLGSRLFLFIVRREPNKRFLSSKQALLQYFVLFDNFHGTTGRDGIPGKRQKLVPGQTFGKEREIAGTTQDLHLSKVSDQLLMCFTS